MQEVLIPSRQHASNKSTFYAVCVVLSIVISWGIFSQFLFTADASLSSFFQQAFSTPVTTLLSSDIILSALIFLAFARIELKRLNRPSTWLALYVLATCSVGVCCALSLFLYQRERWLNKAVNEA